MSNYTGKKIKTFRERFVELCNESPLGTVSLADKLHVSRQTINAWKVGTRSPKDLTVIAIAKHFGVSVEWLMG
ncbi:MAG: helix-turn-helix transcriptional regulator, partial [Lachnospiraceae bacterium]|nr:helix-turn-helix transcriptional regulator [Lachnospiraceae bacterium]